MVVQVRDRRAGACASCATLPVAESPEGRAALLFPLDRSARLASIANPARFVPAGRYFVNFTPTAIYNPAYCLQSTVKIEVIAEGIERPEERDWLSAAGIRLMQGYLFARSFPA